MDTDTSTCMKSLLLEGTIMYLKMQLYSLMLYICHLNMSIYCWERYTEFRTKCYDHQ